MHNIYFKNETQALNSPLRTSSTCSQFWVGAGDKADESLKWTNALGLNSYCKCLSTLFKLSDVDNFCPNLFSSLRCPKVSVDYMNNAVQPSFYYSFIFTHEMVELTLTSADRKQVVHKWHFNQCELSNLVASFARKLPFYKATFPLPWILIRILTLLLPCLIYCCMQVYRTGPAA